MAPEESISAAKKQPGNSETIKTRHTVLDSSSSLDARYRVTGNAVAAQSTFPDVNQALGRTKRQWLQNYGVDDTKYGGCCADSNRQC